MVTGLIGSMKNLTKLFVFFTDIAVSSIEEDVLQAVDAVRTIRFDEPEIKASDSKTKSKDQKKSHHHHHEGRRKHHAGTSSAPQVSIFLVHSSATGCSILMILSNSKP